MPFSVPAARLARVDADLLVRPTFGHIPLTPDSSLMMFADVIPRPDGNRWSAPVTWR